MRTTCRRTARLALLLLALACDAREPELFEAVDLLAPVAVGEQLGFVERERAALYRIAGSDLNRAHDFEVMETPLGGRPIDTVAEDGELLVLGDGREPTLHRFRAACDCQAGCEDAHDRLALPRPYTTIVRARDGRSAVLFADGGSDTFGGNTHLLVADLDSCVDHLQRHVEFEVDGLGEPPTTVVISNAAAGGPMVAALFESHAVVASVDPDFTGADVFTVGIDDPDFRPLSVALTERWAAIQDREQSLLVIGADPRDPVRRVQLPGPLIAMRGFMLDAVPPPGEMAGDGEPASDRTDHLLALVEDVLADRHRLVLIHPMDERLSHVPLDFSPTEIVLQTAGSTATAALYSTQGTGGVALAQVTALGTQVEHLLLDVDVAAAHLLPAAREPGDSSDDAGDGAAEEDDGDQEHEEQSFELVIGYADGGMGVLEPGGHLSSTGRRLDLSGIIVDAEHRRAVAAVDDRTLAVVSLDDGQVVPHELTAPIAHITLVGESIVVSHPSTLGRLSVVLPEPPNSGAAGMDAASVVELAGFLARPLGGAP